VNITTNVAELNTDVTNRPWFDEAQLSGDEHWYTIILGDLLPEWGEGATTEEAVKDLAESLWHLHRDLHDWSDDRLAPHLRHQKRFLCTLARAFGKHR
jgi:hypothetical protein